MTDIRSRDAGQLPIAHWQDKVQVVPEERRPQEPGRYPLKQSVGFALRVEMRHFVSVHERGHARVGQWDALTRVFERRPDHVSGADVLRGARYPEDAMRTRERALEARKVVEITLHHLGAEVKRVFAQQGSRLCD
jgi:hypothetical protein